MKILPVILVLIIIGTAVWFVPRYFKSSFMRETERTYILCVEAVTEQLEEPTSASFQVYQEAIDNNLLTKFYWVGWVDSDNESGTTIKTNFNCARTNNTATIELQ